MLIGEVASQSGVSARMLRHYDALGLVRPTGRTVGGYREYRLDDIRRIFHVEGLRSLGLSLREVGQALDDPGFTPAALVADLTRKTEQRLAQQQELLGRLRKVDAARPSDWQDVLRLVALMRDLGSDDAARRQQAVLAPGEDAPLPADLLAEAVLAETDQNVAGALRWALARSGADAVPALASGLRSGEAEIRRRAVLALAELPGAAATAFLTEALADDDPAVRRRAALAVGARGGTAAIPVLVEAVVEGRNDVEAAELLAVLAREPEWGERILRALLDELDAPATDSAIRVRLTQALAEMPADLALDPLRRLTRDPDRSVALLATTLVDRLP
ncbi:HEAT repeat domain-containing protein [Nocardia sp. NPDC048505]|uniref:HEAT repeat domain-containing protein n=1 Tax=unclassified Nocardia TaxID=2637762 RepID=UPI0033CAF082